MTQAWQALFHGAMRLIDDAQERAGAELFWTMGGGTVLMLRHHHRVSKDIDIFFRDPQPLGFVNPRLGGIAEEMTSKYDESSIHVKLYLSGGEIDFVASPLLTSPGFEIADVLGRRVRLETDVEIIAKKMWHRGHEAKARDLFDLVVLIEASPDALRKEGVHLVRHREEFLRRLHERASILRAQFEAIDALIPRKSFDDCVRIASDFLMSLGPATRS